MVRLPPLSLFPGEGGAAAAGIAIDPATGDIWFAEFYRQRIGRLRKVPEPSALSSGDLSFSFGREGFSTPAEVRLHQNLPNPFNAATLIQYDLPRPGRVKIEVFNILGERVKILIDEFQEAGYRNILWDGRDEGGAEVASGVYFYLIEAGDLVSAKRMTLVR